MADTGRVAHEGRHGPDPIPFDHMVQQMRKPEVSDEMIEHAASQMEMIIAEMRRTRPTNIQIHTSRHVIETPLDSYIHREDGGLDTFGVLVTFPLGVMTLPKPEAD